MSLIVDGTTGVTFNDSSLQGAAASPYVLKNRIINGDMRIDQRNAGASVSISSGGSGYSVDRWFYEYSGSATGVTIQQVTDAPTGFSNSIKLTVGTGAAVAAGNYFDVEHKIEGFNWSDMVFGTANAKTVTLSFWVKSSISGTYGICLQNAASAATRCYATSYTISSANTWEQKTVTITGDTSGTWVGSSNACAINIIFAAGVGSTFQTSTINSWQSNGFAFPNTITNTIISTSGATLQFTGVQLEIGTSATPFERRLYGQELALCQRYYLGIGYNADSGFSNRFGSGYIETSTLAVCLVTFPVTMRTNPTGTVSANGDWSVTNASTYTASNVTFASNPNTALVNVTSSGMTAAQSIQLRSVNSNSKMSFSAEL